MLDPHQILGLRPDADRSAIRAAYCRIVKRLHPDVAAQDAEAQELLRQVIAAYSHLRRPNSDPFEVAYRAADCEARRYTWIRRATISVACILLSLPLSLDAVKSLSDGTKAPKAGRPSPDSARPTETNLRWVHIAASSFDRPNTVKANSTATHAAPVNASLDRIEAAATNQEIKQPISESRGELLAARFLSEPAAMSPPRIDRARNVVAFEIGPVAPRELIDTGEEPEKSRRQHAAPADKTAGSTAAKLVGAKQTNSLAHRTSNASSDVNLFSDSRFGIAVNYPKDAFPIRRLSRHATDRLFRSRDGRALLRVKTMAHGKGNSVANELRNRLASHFKGFKVEADMYDAGFVVRGTSGVESFVERVEVTCSGRLAHRTLLIYPARDSETYAAVAQGLAATSVIVGRPRLPCATLVSEYLLDK